MFPVTTCCAPCPLAPPTSQLAGGWPAGANGGLPRGQLIRVGALVRTSWSMSVSRSFLVDSLIHPSPPSPRDDTKFLPPQVVPPECFSPTTPPWRFSFPRATPFPPGCFLGPIGFPDPTQFHRLALGALRASHLPQIVRPIPVLNPNVFCPSTSPPPPPPVLVPQKERRKSAPRRPSTPSNKSTSNDIKGTENSWNRQLYSSSNQSVLGKKWK